ncbi:MAG: NADH-quinone oxidoreductase subunit F [Alphaproteobacteria bacterium]|nr:MAG: NADH-quinone oxidoreductase subunit F [Alphaproteobacteria bacterium]
MNVIDKINDKDKSRRPGSGRRAARNFPKGRLLDPKDRDRLGDIVGEAGGDGPLARDLLIEYLHEIQDSERCLPAGLLHALAERMHIPMAEIYEVASFYAHFDIVDDDEEKPPPVTIRVCDSVTCMMAGSETLIAELQEAALDGVRVLRAPCMGRCANAPVCEVGHGHVDDATAASVAATVKSGDLHPKIPAYKDFKAYLAEGGYGVLKACLAGEKSVEDVIAVLGDAGLAGLGGAGFPTGRKWGLVRDTQGPRLMAVNGDEGEPGTFKDRYFLETDPCAFLEGMLIGAWAVEAEAVYLYMRDEYPAVLEILRREIAAVEQAGLSGHTKIHLRRGAGAYICGEESAMIESIEGKRGLPRHRPPYVAEVGIFGRPTLVNNIETLYWVPQILENGADWFASKGINGAKGLRSYSVSGRVKNPGVKIVPAGVTARQLVDEYSGGMCDGHQFKGYLPGGASGGILPARLADIPLDFGTLAEHGAFVGSHAVVILSDADDMKAIALNLMRFFEDESCGQCTPCRTGTEKAVKLMERESWDIDALNDLAIVMADASICGLGQAAPNPLTSVLKFFPGDIR